MRKVMKTIKVEKKKKFGSEKTCLDVLHKVAKAMADNCEIEIRIIHPDTKIHLIPTVDDDDENEESEWHGDLSPSIEAMKQIFNGDDTACCGNYCGHTFTAGDHENPNMKEVENADRAEADESM